MILNWLILNWMGLELVGVGVGLVGSVGVQNQEQKAGLINDLITDRFSEQSTMVQRLEADSKTRRPWFEDGSKHGFGTKARSTE